MGLTWLKTAKDQETGLVSSLLHLSEDMMEKVYALKRRKSSNEDEEDGDIMGEL